MSQRLRVWRVGTMAACLGLLVSGASFKKSQAQNQQGQGPQEEETRQIKLSDFTKKRPPAKSSISTAKPTSAGGDTASWNAPTYHRVPPKPRVHPRSSGVAAASHSTTPVSKPTTAEKPVAKTPTEIKEVGVTLWRMRPAKETDTGPGFSVLQNGKMVVLTPERIEGTAPVSLGDRMRISIESPRTGYLYVINREQYADGKTGKPGLIFPTLRVRGGDNAVVAGRLVDIPDANDGQPFFTLTSHQKPGEPAIVGELITVLITEKPLPGIAPARTALPLDPAKVDKWEDEWSGDVVELLEMNGGEGKTWTAEEKMAGEATRSLTQEDPTPQTIYRVASKPNEPVMLTVQLIYGTTPAPGSAASSKP
jgi:hypothetical protein